MFNFLLCSEGITGNCSNLLMKVFRLPFVHGNNSNETHVYALKLIHTPQYGSMWNMVQNGQKTPIYPATNSDDLTFCPEFVNALMGAYKVVFYAPKILNRIDKSFKVSQKLLKSNIESTMKSQYTHANQRITVPS